MRSNDKAKAKSDKPIFAKGWFHLCLWSFGMFILVGFSFYYGKAIPAGAVTLFGMVIGAYTANKTFVKIASGKTIGEIRLTKK